MKGTANRERRRRHIPCLISISNGLGAQDENSSAGSQLKHAESLQDSLETNPSGMTFWFLYIHEIPRDDGQV